MWFLFTCDCQYFAGSDGLGRLVARRFRDAVELLWRTWYGLMLIRIAIHIVC